MTVVPLVVWAVKTIALFRDSFEDLEIRRRTEIIKKKRITENN